MESLTHLTSISEHSDWLEENYRSSQTKWHLHRLRVEFGKQSPNLGMFIPCDLDGNFLEEPKLLREYPFECYDGDNEQYQESKNNCLFKGFQFYHGGKYNLKKDDQIFDINEFGTIEDLVKYKPKLTASALKQIGL